VITPGVQEQKLNILHTLKVIIGKQFEMVGAVG
jgi:hypothetical protein